MSIKFLVFTLLVCLFASCSTTRKKITLGSRHELSSLYPREIVEVDGVKLVVNDPDKTSGNPVIVCLHAIGHGGRDFDYFRAFGNKYRIITIDWPGHGRTSNDHKPASLKRYHELFETLVTKLKLPPMILFGNSIGGGVAIKYAASHPEMVKAMILSNPAGLDKGGLGSGLFLWWVERKFQSGADGESGFASWFEKHYEKVLITKAAKDEKKRIVDSGYEIAPVLTEAWHSFGEKEHDMRPFISKIEVPIFFAWAKEDKFVAWSRNEDAVEKFKNKTIKFYHAGHSPFLETPEKFNQDAKLFLESIPL